MKKIIKISEQVMKEFIGPDLEPISGTVQDIKTTGTYTNPFPPKNGEDTPITQDEYIKQSRVPWWGRHLFRGYGGGIGFSYNGGLHESETIKEDNILRGSGPNDVMPAQETIDKQLDVANLTSLYNESALTNKINELVQSLNSLTEEPDDSDMIKAIALNHILSNIQFEGLDNNIRNIIKSKL